MVHPRWDTSKQKLAVLYYYTIQQNEGMQPAATSLHFLFTLSRSLSHNHKDCLQCYNTIQHTIVLQRLPFIKGIPWVSQIPWACKTPIINQVMTLKLQHFTRHFFLNFRYGRTAPEPLVGGRL